jgi:hypothetical protein
MDPDSDPAIFVTDLQCQQKTNFSTQFSAYYFLKLHLHHFSKIKSQNESLNSRNQGFSYYFCMMIEGSGSRAGSGSGSGSTPLTSGSGSGRPKNTCADPDPQHWLEGIMTMYPRSCLQTVVFGSCVRCMMNDQPFAMTVTQYSVPAAP